MQADRLGAAILSVLVAEAASGLVVAADGRVIGQPPVRQPALGAARSDVGAPHDQALGHRLECDIADRQGQKLAAAPSLEARTALRTQPVQAALAARVACNCMVD